METQPEFILVTGPNGAGKSTFIRNNEALLASYRIILPDEMPHYREQLQEAALARENIIYETPFQFENFKETLDQLRNGGYRLVLYQIFLRGLQHSLDRVDIRNQDAGRQLSAENVKETFISNFRNVALHYFYFHHSYFLDNTDPPGRERNLLVASFAGMELTYYRQNESGYLRQLFEDSNRQGRMDDKAMEIIRRNEDYRAGAFLEPELKPRGFKR